jgi:hypothetical protein
MRSWPTTLVFGLVPLIILASLGGILLPSTYARETANWAAQGIGQDWADLLLLVPTLLAAAVATRRGSRGARLILAGALLYAIYSFVLYAFAVHFNALFLVYCAALGLSVYALAGLAQGFVLEDEKAWFSARAPVKTLGVLSVVLGLAFAALWLAEDLPALRSGALPASVQLGGFFTNPVHVLDLSVVLPAITLSGIALLRRRPRGYVLAPVMASFGALMGLTLAVLFVVLHLEGEASNLGLAAGMTLIAGLWGAALVAFLRAMVAPPPKKQPFGGPGAALAR